MLTAQTAIADAFTDIVTTTTDLREIVGQPRFWLQPKVMDHLDRRCRNFIAMSPFIIIASVNASGQVDVSPKGDPPGFVRVLDDRTLAVPDRQGNRRCDTFHNIVDNPNVGMIFLVPGKGETLRIAGRARLVRDLAIRQAMSLDGKVPDLAAVVAVDAPISIARSAWRARNCGRRNAPAHVPTDWVPVRR